MDPGRAFALFLAAGLAAGPVGAQDLPDRFPGPVGTPLEARPGAPAAPGDGGLRDALSSPGGAFLSSLVLPGAGQAALGLRRWAAYGLVEVGLWAVHLEAGADVRSLTDRYRDLAWEEARAASERPRRDGDWDYYEHMTQYLSSGAYDLTPGIAGLQPETDEGTYNGTVWALARALFLPPGAGGPGSPEYALALDYYQERAAGPAFLWSWEGNEAALDRFRALIREADDEARLESTALGLVLANHLVSAVDAFVVARMRANPGLRLDSRLTPVGPALRWSVGLRIPIHH
ncbi:MAG: hypothetical protein GWM90_12195 [Gemmatimonadetes bacterium]|nr:hypothetical protein [Gemmatimonadota bacterium]NIQ54767.1 hypothetical protein [Gemmatimonadota bacterium]NIU74976.1 hypothetical protein [Gammaproteobacteria bacterium]NIX44849.1 hypothetical protein [Gemmatimonadota bacterium]NIY09087.1 hypothetical protein [Gemmatimonadota bacterium]